MTIKRYSDSDQYMPFDPEHGKFVLYADHAAEVERLQSSVRAQMEVTASVSSSLRNADERIKELETQAATDEGVKKWAADRIEELEAERDALEHDIARYVKIASDLASERDAMLVKAREAESELRPMDTDGEFVLNPPKEKP